MAFLSYTATQLAYKALRHLGALRPGQSTSPDMLNDILSELNDMIDSWQLDKRKVWAIRPDAYTLTAGQQFYLIGPGASASTIGGVSYGAFNAPRPNEIKDANVILNSTTPTVRRPLQILDVDEWADIRVQGIPSAIPLKLWYDNNFVSNGGGESGSQALTGYGVISLWPGPLENYQLELYTDQNLALLLSFANLTTSYSFPPGYAEAITFSLAEKIWPMARIYLKLEPKTMLDPMIVRQANGARERIENQNKRVEYMRVDMAMRGGNRGSWNYGIGEYNGGER